MADRIPVLTDPLVLANRLYLRTAEGKAVVRPPSPPLPMAADGQVAAALQLYRHNDGDPHGGATLAVVVDLARPWEAAERADAELPSRIADVVGAVHRDGRVRLTLAGREVDSAPVGAGARPVVAMTGRLDVLDASLLINAIDDESAPTPLHATVEGRVVVDGGGIRLAVHVDGAAARRELAGSGEALAVAEAAAAVEQLVQSGAVRVDAEGQTITDAAMLIATAFAGAALFEPGATGAPWMAVPGVRLPGYEPDGALRLRTDLADTVRLTLDGTLLPWCAAAPVVLGRAARSEWTLPSTRVVVLAVWVHGTWPAEVRDPVLELGFVVDGPITAFPLTDDRTMLRLLPPDGRADTFRRRVAATAPDGTRLVGPWVTERPRHISLLAANEAAQLAHAADGQL